MSEPRFVVDSLSGYEIRDGRDASFGHKLTSYYVFDTLYSHTIVHAEHASTRYGGEQLRRARRRAKKECERLNAWWEWELQRG